MKAMVAGIITLTIIGFGVATGSACASPSAERASGGVMNSVTTGSDTGWVAPADTGW